MKKIIILISGLAISLPVMAVDVYGVSNSESTKILKTYKREITELESLLKKEVSNHKQIVSENHIKKSASAELLSKKKKALITKIKQDNEYLYVDFESIFYPDNNNKIYSTIDIVDKQHPERLKFLRPLTKVESNKPRTHKPDIIESMITYNALSFDLLFHHKITSFPPCPVYHCTIGFEHPKLKPYLEMFNKAAIKEKGLIIQSLNDPDPKRRAAAAFLVGHFRHPQEIVSLLTHYIDDKDDEVRNNVMRVIGRTLEKAKINNLDVNPYLEALDSPLSTDRNKALLVIFGAANSKTLQPVILKKGGDRLVNLLQLQQPNNHDWAYEILKKITGKDFGPTNVAAWRANLMT